MSVWSMAFWQSCHGKVQYAQIIINNNNNKINIQKNELWSLSYAYTNTDP